MNQNMKQRQITISVRDLQLNQQDDKPSLNDISCYLTVYTEDKETREKTNKCFDLLILTDPHNGAKFKLLKNENQFLKVQLKTLSKQKLIGRVTLNLSLFVASNNISSDQWITLKMNETDGLSQSVTGNLQQQSMSGKIENDARIKLRMQISECDQEKRIAEDNIQNRNNENNSQLNTSLQPCVNFPMQEDSKKFDFSRICKPEELEQTQQTLGNIESRLVLTPERHSNAENSMICPNKFQDLIEKLMETRNQSLVLGMAKQLNESQRNNLEKTNLTDILKRLNDSYNGMEDEMDHNNGQGLNLNFSMSDIQRRRTQQSPEVPRRNKHDLEGEIASLRLELQKKQELEQTVKDLKSQLFNAERNNENLLSQYNKAIDNYQIYYSEINDENLVLKKKIAQFDEEKIETFKEFNDLKSQFNEKIQEERQRLKKELSLQMIKTSSEAENNLEKEQDSEHNSSSQKIALINNKCKQEIQQYSLILSETQNENVELQARMQEMQKDIQVLEEKLKNQYQNGFNSDTQTNGATHILSESDEAYIQKILKEKTMRVTQIEGEKATLDFSNQQKDKLIIQLKDKLKEFEAQKDQKESQEVEKLIESNKSLKCQVDESEQLRITLEDHLLKTKQNFQKKIEELHHKQNKIQIDLQQKAKEEQIQNQEEINAKRQIHDEIIYKNKELKMKVQTMKEKYIIMTIKKLQKFKLKDLESLRIIISEKQEENSKINSDLYKVTSDLLKKIAECISQQQFIHILTDELSRKDHLLLQQQQQQQQQQQLYQQQRAATNYNIKNELISNISLQNDNTIQPNLYAFQQITESQLNTFSSKLSQLQKQQSQTFQDQQYQNYLQDQETQCESSNQFSGDEYSQPDQSMRNYMIVNIKQQNAVENNETNFQKNKYEQRMDNFQNQQNVTLTGTQSQNIRIQDENYIQTSKLRTLESNINLNSLNLQNPDSYTNYTKQLIYHPANTVNHTSISKDIKKINYSSISTSNEVNNQLNLQKQAAITTPKHKEINLNHDRILQLYSQNRENQQQNNTTHQQFTRQHSFNKVSLFTK